MCISLCGFICLSFVCLTMFVDARNTFTIWRPIMSCCHAMSYLYIHSNLLHTSLPAAVSVGCEYEGTDSVQAAFHRCDEKVVSLHERDVHTSGGDRRGKFCVKFFIITGGAIFSVLYVCTLAVECSSLTPPISLLFCNFSFLSCDCRE